MKSLLGGSCHIFSNYLLFIIQSLSYSNSRAMSFARVLDMVVSFFAIRKPVEILESVRVNFSYL